MPRWILHVYVFYLGDRSCLWGSAGGELKRQPKLCTRAHQPSVFAAAAAIQGPPTIVPPAMFKEMERAAQRLTQNIGYRGAGTVEYLYNPESNSFFFLELNPRLQVRTKKGLRMQDNATRVLLRNPVGKECSRRRSSCFS